MIPEPSDTNREVPVNETFHVQTDDELTEKELKQIQADNQAIQTILLGLPKDIYVAVDSCETTQEIWLRVQQMMKGFDIGIQEKKAKLFNEWERNFMVRPRRRDAAYLQTQLLIAQKEEAGIQLQAEEFDLMAAAADLDEIEEVNVNCILVANLQQASTSGTKTDKALVYDSDGSAEYTELLESIPEPHQVPQNDNNVISEVTIVEQSGETVEQHPTNFEETRALYDSLYHNLAIEVEKVNTVNRKLKETNADLTTELARFKNQEKCFEISQEKYDKLERCYQHQSQRDLPRNTSLDRVEVLGSDDGVTTSFQRSQDSRPHAQFTNIHLRWKLKGRLLASFQDREHEGGDTRSQGGIILKDKDLEISVVRDQDPRSQACKWIFKRIPKNTRLQVTRRLKKDSQLNDHPLGGDCLPQIAQPGMNMGQDRQMQMIGGNGGNQFRQNAGQNAGNLNGYNEVQNVENQVAQNPRIQNVGNQNGGIGHYARNCTSRPRRRDAAYLQTQLLIAQKEEAGIQLQAEEYDLMAAAADLDEIEEVNANCILMANLQQASTSGTQTDKALVYDSDESAEAMVEFGYKSRANRFIKSKKGYKICALKGRKHIVCLNERWSNESSFIEETIF
nr:hypothetical protein [Tanacetum cinerariifolium]